GRQGGDDLSTAAVLVGVRGRDAAPGATRPAGRRRPRDAPRHRGAGGRGGPPPLRPADARLPDAELRRGRPAPRRRTAARRRAGARRGNAVHARRAGRVRGRRHGRPAGGSPRRDAVHRAAPARTRCALYVPAGHEGRLAVLGPHARVLVIAPHPDDETLGSGGLLARAAAHGAAIRVLVVTDGESNPWAQRAAECRWQIGEENEVRWGARRRDETMAAVEALGVDAAALRFLGFADQGLTRLLLGGGGGSIDVLAAKIAAFAPTVVVGPDLDDRHPDHSALAVLLTLACERCAGSIPFARLAYLVHGRVGPGDRMRLTLDRATRARKHRAAFAHASQLAALVRRLGPAPRRETFLDPRTGAGHPVRH